MQALNYTSKEINRNLRIKVSGLGIHELKGVSGFVGLVGCELANNLLDRAFRSKGDKVACKLRRGLKITFYYK
ncbi:ribosomal large subunit pseudouridine synthase B [Alistipes sp.]|uniref:ribosomal large subunit pseudouridine synthase B n=1 Tax=Alistipes sp. TaxID=1872444 RepID=UPI003AF18A8A